MRYNNNIFVERVNRKETSHANYESAFLEQINREKKAKLSVFSLLIKSI